MRIKTTRFGEIEVNEGDIITFTQPILGFQEFRRFVLLPGPEGGNLKWLQSTESGDLAFILMNPKDVMPAYTVELSPAELSELAVVSASELEVYTLVVAATDRAKIRTNLKAPILINPKHRLGKQTILDRGEYPVQYYLAQPQRGHGQPEEATHARSDA